MIIKKRCASYLEQYQVLKNQDYQKVVLVYAVCYKGAKKLLLPLLKSKPETDKQC